MLAYCCTVLYCTKQFVSQQKIKCILCHPRGSQHTSLAGTDVISAYRVSLPPSLVPHPSISDRKTTLVPGRRSPHRKPRAAIQCREEIERRRNRCSAENDIGCSGGIFGRVGQGVSHGYISVPVIVYVLGREITRTNKTRTHRSFVEQLMVGAAKVSIQPHAIYSFDGFGPIPWR